ncbi:MAG TPA: nuclease [Granulicella sp.]
MKTAALSTLVALAALPLYAQNGVGTVSVEDATVAGDLSVTGGRAILRGSSSITAKDHTAEIALTRGGTVRVCATSRLHLAQTYPGSMQPLLLALDNGAIEMQANAMANDILITPDMRFSVQSAGSLDLRVRVTKNGDTCVENRGAAAPMLGITDQFGDASYMLRPDQHVLFEHGSLKEVVDHESSPCGCPAPEQGMSLADALLASHAGTSTTPTAAEQHPFPAAVSQGLAPAPPVPQAAPGAPHAQVSTTMGYSSDGDGTIAGTSTSAAASPAAGTPLNDSAPAASAKQTGLFHSIGHFFKHLFGG